MSRTRYRDRVIASTPARSSLGRSLALGLSLSLALPTGLSLCPQPAHAAGAAAAVEPAEDPAVEEARKLYDEGKARFDTFDYEGAVQLWTQAYGKLPEDAAGIRNSMVYNIATAQEKAFELDSDVQHLRQAQMLLESYIDNYKALYPRTPETKAEVDKAEDRIASLKERIEDADKGDTRPPPPIDGEIGWNSESAPPVDPALMEKNRRLADEERKTDRMLIASYVTLSVGTLFTLGGMSALGGASRREDQTPVDPAMPVEDPEPDATTQGLRGGGYGILALGLAGLVTGFTLLGVGLDRRKKAKNGTLVTSTPVLGPGFAGATVRVRF